MRLIITTILVICFSFTVFSQKAEKINERQIREIEQTVLKTKESWTDALKSKDWVILEQILASDFVAVNVDKVMNKAEFINDYKASTDKIRWAVNSNVKVQVYTRDVAVMTGETEVGGQALNTHQKMQDFIRRWHWTDTYLKRNGMWQCIATHISVLKNNFLYEG